LRNEAWKNEEGGGQKAHPTYVGGLTKKNKRRRPHFLQSLEFVPTPHLGHLKQVDPIPPFLIFLFFCVADKGLLLVGEGVVQYAVYLANSYNSKKPAFLHLFKLHGKCICAFTISIPLNITIIVVS